jgi:hypothetical protein
VLGRFTHRWKNNIKKRRKEMDVWVCVYGQTQLVQRQAFTGAVMKLPVV